jgi:hypothetical protein
MAAKAVAPGRLVAIDGSRGADVAAAAEALAAGVRQRGGACLVSRWDASGLFTELLSSPIEALDVSPRTLSLLYGADLAFRLRWEIRPALAAGQIVIAAPYVETAAAFGMASGLPELWLRDLLRFAPPADTRGLAPERKPGEAWKRRADRGFPEYCAMVLDASGRAFRRKRTREAMVAALDSGRTARAWRLEGKKLAAAAKALTSSR